MNISVAATGEWPSHPPRTTNARVMPPSLPYPVTELAGPLSWSSMAVFREDIHVGPDEGRGSPVRENESWYGRVGRRVARGAVVLAALVAVGVVGAPAFAGPVTPAVSCSGNGCNGQDPSQTGCSANAKTLASAPLVTSAGGTV